MTVTFEGIQRVILCSSPIIVAQMWYCSTFNQYIIFSSGLNSSSCGEIGGIAQKEQHIMQDKRSLKTTVRILEWNAKEDVKLNVQFVV